MDIEIGGETFHKEPNLLEQIACRDTWGRGADSFIAMIYKRLILMRDWLTKTAFKADREICSKIYPISCING